MSSEPQVVIETSKGTMKAVLFSDKAPKTVANFLSLVDKKFYDGKIFHRVIKGFVVQGGCPKGDGTGGLDETIPLEVGAKHEDGALGMARSSDPDSASCQFYICDGPQHGLDSGYAVFGKVVEGNDVIKKLSNVQTRGDRPVDPLTIVSIRRA